MVKEFEELPSDEDYGLDDIDDYARAICMAQKDAWNACIKWAANNVELYCDQQIILKGLVD